MPYYCTVPQCTSMAGKAKNVSFHQFPRDEELARLWNHILKRGKPYTKYSKVCSLHFRPEDYTITSVGKNKGQWRTLRKDAVPSRNLPSEGPPTSHRRNSATWLPHPPVTTVMDARMQQQMAQAIYMQTMLAMQQASANGLPQHTPEPVIPPSHVTISDIEQVLQNRTTNDTSVFETAKESSSYKCMECSKCFKDPDVFLLHKRSHTSKIEKEQTAENGKENCNSTGNGVSSLSRQETLRANPILANLLRSGIPGTLGDGSENGFDVSNIMSIENQIMATLTANMESYIRSLSSMLAEAKSKTEGMDQDVQSSEQDDQESEQNDLESDQNHEHNENVEHNIQGSRSRLTFDHSDRSPNQPIIDVHHIKSEIHDTLLEQNDQQCNTSTPFSQEKENDLQNCGKNCQVIDLNNLKTEMDSFDEDFRESSLEKNTEMESQCSENITDNGTSDKETHLVTLADLGIELDSRREDNDSIAVLNLFVEKSITASEVGHAQYVERSIQTGQTFDVIDQHYVKNDNFDKSRGSADPICDSEDLIQSKDSN